MLFSRISSFVLALWNAAVLSRARVVEEKEGACACADIGSAERRGVRDGRAAQRD